MDNDNKKIVLSLIDTFQEAGKIALNLRDKGLEKIIKEDGTPVTNGDLEVNKVITLKIQNITPDIPIVSEESSINKNLNNLDNFWLIDPIDGTFDYINNKEEFTLNAALIFNKEPVLGIIYAPAKKRLFYSHGKDNSYEIKDNKTKKLTAGKDESNHSLKALTYSDKIKSEILNIHKKYNISENLKMKSSLKFCVIASGEYDLYVADPRACEWDIAAGHAILNHAGGSVTDWDGKKILYGKKDFKNPGIILKGYKLQ